uniref:hypothetical protein n=1 Tax=Nocardia brasiliensis TaxID=37326 RepID=UPI002453A05B
VTTATSEVRTALPTATPTPTGPPAALLGGGASPLYWPPHPAAAGAELDVLDAESLIRLALSED